MLRLRRGIYGTTLADIMSTFFIGITKNPLPERDALKLCNAGMKIFLPFFAREIAAVIYFFDALSGNMGKKFICLLQIGGSLQG